VIGTQLIEVRNYREITRFIPGDVLHHICEATEDEGDRNLVERKHRKNLNILSMMGVCRSWNDQIRGLNGLFADIAFDTSRPSTISTAARFLGIIEAQSNNIRVYARCIIWFGDETQMAFLSRLRLQSWRFVCFEVEHMSAPFIAHFNLPAPRLLRLVHTPALPDRLFASSFTNLRVLNASVKQHFPWPTATFPNLVTLRLENVHSSRRFCATSLLDLIGYANQLEELRLIDFLRFSGGSRTKPLTHTSLKSIHFAQCNLKFVLQHLQFPNATTLRVESYGIGLDGELNLPPPKDTSYFTPLQALPIPVLDQHVVTGVTIHMQDWFTDDIYFKISLRCRASRSIDFTATFRKVDGWEVYFQSSVDEMLRRVRLGARVNLSIFHYFPLSPISPPTCELPLFSPDLPLLRLPQVALLRTDHSLVQNVIQCLADLDHRLLPNLKCYSFDVGTQPASVDLAAPETLACLRSRFNDGIPFALQYWTLDGKIKYDLMLSIYADTKRSQMLI